MLVIQSSLKISRSLTSGIIELAHQVILPPYMHFDTDLRVRRIVAVRRRSVMVPLGLAFASHSSIHRRIIISFCDAVKLPDLLHTCGSFEYVMVMGEGLVNKTAESLVVKYTPPVIFSIAYRSRSLSDGI